MISSPEDLIVPWSWHSGMTGTVLLTDGKSKFYTDNSKNKIY